MSSSLVICWQKCTDFVHRRRLVIVLIGIGILLRLKYYSENLSLWLDEAALVLEIIRRSFREIFFGLHYNPFSPTAPIGFLVTEKAAIGIFGNNEFVLRFLPLGASIISIFLFFILVKRRCRGAGALTALAIFAFAGPLIHYSVQVKPYALDVLAAVVSFLAADYVRAARLNLWPTLILGVVGAVAMWLSYGAIFVWVGVLPTLILFRLLRRQFADVAFLSLAACLVALSLQGLYFSDLGQIGSNSQLYTMWEKAFMPWPIGSWKSIVWLKDAFLGMFTAVLGLFLAPLAAGLFVLGAIAAFRKDREWAILLMLPLGAALAAAMIHKYPFSGRSVLFLAPSLAILTAEGIMAIAARIPKYSNVWMFVFAAGILFHPLNNAADVFLRDHAFEEMRPAMSYFKDHYQAHDAIYLNNSAQYAYGYYGEHFGLDIRTSVIGISFDEMPPGVLFDPADGARYILYPHGPSELWPVVWCWGGKTSDPIKKDWQQIRYNKRTWLIFSHVYTSARQPVLGFFEREGRKLDEFHSPGASIYLYDLSKT